ncbi:MAG: hypothetical protein ACLQG3_06500 [Terracidiphilus sp.]
MASDALYRLRSKCGSSCPAARGVGLFCLPLLASALILIAAKPAEAQASQSQAAQPAAPAPQAEPSPARNPSATPTQSPSPAPESNPPAKADGRLDPCAVENAGPSTAATGGSRTPTVAGAHGSSPAVGSTAVEPAPCNKRVPIVDWYKRFLTGPEVKRFSPAQKLRLAGKNLLDPFNLVTVFGGAGIGVAANSHTPYGPGFPGWGKLSGVNFTQDMTDQFFGTFLVPAITRTDPHYHRRPDMRILRRALHCFDQVFWQRADNGKRTFNYSQIVAPIADISISNLYVPGQQTRFSADAKRYGIDLANAPIENLITEFVPSIASRIHTHVVFVQRIINRIATNPP